MNEHIDLNSCPVFYLVFHEKHDPSKSISKMIANLGDRKLAFVYLDSHGTIGLLQPLSQAELQKLEYPFGFKCYVYSVERQQSDGFGASSTSLY